MRPVNKTQQENRQSWRAVVVGLGIDSLPILQTVQDVFAEQKASDELRVCLCAPSLPEANPGVEMPLDAAALADLYYRQNVRVWSGPNWKRWGEDGKLGYTRMAGYLAHYLHLNTLYDALQRRVGELSSDGDVRLNFYLVGHLHDPFASGGFPLAGYLLHQIALKLRGSHYGMLWLPGLTNDPLQALKEADRRLQLATAYAALRELSFYSDRESFFRAHHPDIVLEANGASPFQTGDCYLIGGEQGEPHSDVDYDTTIENSARWIYLQTCTPLRDVLPQSDNNRGVVSSFGITSASLPKNTESEFAAEDIALALLARQVEVRRIEGNSDGYFVQPWLNVASMLQVNAVNTRQRAVQIEESRSGASSRLQQLDDRYRERIELLQEREAQFARNTERRLVMIRRQLPQQVKELRQRPEMTLYTFERVMQRARARIQSDYLSGQSALTQLSSDLPLYLRQLRDARAQYRYVHTVPLSLSLRLGVSVVVLGGMLLLVTYGFIVEMLLWVFLVPLITIGGALFLRQRRQREAILLFRQARQELIQAQEALIDRRIINAYLYDLRDIFDRTFHMVSINDEEAEDVTYVQHLRDTIDVVLNERQLPATVQVDDPNDLLLSAVFARLWQPEAVPQWMPDTLLQAVIEVVEDEQVDKQHGTTQNQLMSAVDSALNKLTNPLAVNTVLLPPSDRNRVLRGVAWLQAENLLNYVDFREFMTARQLVSVPMRSSYHHEIDAKYPVPFVLVRLRQNIAIRALMDLPRWQRAYQAELLYQAEETYYLYPEFLHPVRTGVASPDILRERWQFQMEFVPFVMAVVLLLRAAPAPMHYQEQLARFCQVDWRNRPNYDALCSVLSGQVELLDDMLSAAQAATADLPVSDLLLNLQKCFDPPVTRQSIRPRLSEQYADWEVWIASRLHQMDETSWYSNTREVLARLYEYFANHASAEAASYMHDTAERISP